MKLLCTMRRLSAASGKPRTGRMNAGSSRTKKSGQSKLGRSISKRQSMNSGGSPSMARLKRRGRFL